MTTFSQQSQTRQVTPPRAVLHEDAATGLLTTFDHLHSNPAVMGGNMAKFIFGFVLGTIFFAGTAWAIKSVEVAFYGKGSIWCYLHESINWVECLQDPPCGGR